MAANYIQETFVMTLMSRQALFEAAWKRPLTEIADDLGITSTGLKKICDRHDIPTPGRGYWAQVRAGKTFHRPALRPVIDPRLEEVGILGARPLSPAVAAAVQASRALVAERLKTPSKLPPAMTPPPPGAEPTPAETVEAKAVSLDHKDLAATRTYFTLGGETAGLDLATLERRLSLAYLAPDVTRDIVLGSRGEALELGSLMNGQLPLAWEQQKQVLAVHPE